MDKGHRKCLILWHRIQDWADIIVQFAKDNGLEDSVMTVEELRTGVESQGTGNDISSPCWSGCGTEVDWWNTSRAYILIPWGWLNLPLAQVASTLRDVHLRYEKMNANTQVMLCTLEFTILYFELGYT